MSLVCDISARVRGRDGLRDAAGQLSTRPCTIAYLGSSVTVQRGGYVPRLHQLLCQLWQQPHRMVRAGTGAVGSLSGVFLMDDLVVKHRPQLCFVEYTTFDLRGDTPAEQVGPAVEGIVQKLRDVGCEPCLLYLFRSDIDFEAPNEILAAYEAVAEHHRVPTIDVASPIQMQVASGALDVAGVLRDEVHTTPAGAQCVAEAIARAIPRVAAAAHVNPLPSLTLHRESFRRTRIEPVRREWLRKPDDAQLDRFRLVYRYIRVGVGNPVECSLDGEFVGVVVIVGPSSGVIRVAVGGQIDEIMLWDQHCYYERLGTALFPRRCPPGQAVTIELADVKVDRSRVVRTPPRSMDDSTCLKLVGFLVRG